ncbi:phage holin family protein [Streptacidiphilus sp. PB12-B1b]|uniref:phage holin family protein n=1 Tax=Streptacidiphilus sp. PB12-B1b TaxID=2705012 RepID=UPI0015FA37E0|nr:phage holin family protein [Streptacidiphilus sp. PB12-B1b]QMU77173.1 phage holin family protein [Streptacidiphilus sp. PB12-B1b]
MEHLEHTAAPRTDDPSAGELVSRVTQQLSQLVREEMQLAQAEMKEKGKRFGIGGGLFGAAGLLAFLGLATLVTAAVIALALVLPWWASALIVAGVLLLVAAALAAAGKKEVDRASPPVPEQALTGLKADVTTIKENAKR